MIFAVTISVVAVLYNTLANRWRPFHGWAYVPLNVATATVLLLTAALALDVRVDGFGLTADMGGLWLPIALVGTVALVMFGIARSRSGNRLVDARMAGRRGIRLTYYILVRIPVGTAVTEEIIFRGILFEAWRAAGLSPLGSAGAASFAFGLWHVSPTLTGIKMNDPNPSSRKLRLWVTGAVVLTAAAGLGLAWLRQWSGALLAPIALHAGVNSISALASAYATSRLVKQGEPSSRDSW